MNASLNRQPPYYDVSVGINIPALSKPERTHRDIAGLMAQVRSKLLEAGFVIYPIKSNEKGMQSPLLWLIETNSAEESEAIAIQIRALFESHNKAHAISISERKVSPRLVAKAQAVDSSQQISSISTDESLPIAVGPELVM